MKPYIVAFTKMLSPYRQIRTDRSLWGGGTVWFMWEYLFSLMQKVVSKCSACFGCCTRGAFLTVVGVLAFAPSCMATIGVGVSGIDWDTSTFNITAFTPAHGSGPSYSCAGYTTIPSNIPLSELGFSDENPLSIYIDDCFQQAGDYTIDITLVDFAENSFTTPPISFSVLAGDADPTQSTLSVLGYSMNGSYSATGNCTAQSMLANNDDYCRIQVQLRDAFGNIIENRSGIDVIVQGQSLVGTHHTMSDLTNDSPQVSFVNGLRFDQGQPDADTDQHTETFTSDGNGQHTFDVKALVPTLDIIEGIDNGESQPNYLASRAQRTATFDFIVPDMDPGGAPTGTTTTISFPVTMRYDPPVKLLLSDNDSGAAPTDPFEFLFGLPINIYGYATTETAHNLPSSFEVYIRGLAPSQADFINVDMEQTRSAMPDPNNAFVLMGTQLNYTPVSVSNYEDFATTRLQATGVVADVSVAFTSIIRQLTTEVLEGAGPEGEDIVYNYDVYYPGGNLGNAVGGSTASEEVIFPGIDCGTDPIYGCDETEISAVIVGADIEGKIASRRNQILTQSYDDNLGVTSFNAGQIEVENVREEINRNAYQLIRNQTALGDADLTAGVNFDTLGKNVLYYMNASESNPVEVKLGGTITGVGTIIIRNGNLIVQDDMEYANEDSSLGIILINDKATVRPETGNVLVHADVKKMVGTYFADGSLVSTHLLADPTIYDLDVGGSYVYTTDERATLLDKQLVLDGTLFTRNTLGGHLLDPRFDPWSTSTEPNEAQSMRYDLHFMRRYIPALDAFDQPITTITGNPNCTPADSVSCDRNIHSFTIRADQKVISHTPPGFKVGRSNNLR